jgi:hypothetical protein
VGEARSGRKRLERCSGHVLEISPRYTASHTADDMGVWCSDSTETNVTSEVATRLSRAIDEDEAKLSEPFDPWTGRPIYD